MDRQKKLELIQRALGLKHKIKVHDSMKPPESHEEMSRILLGKWELEDELKAIERVLDDAREENVKDKAKSIAREGLPTKKRKS